MKAPKLILAALLGACLLPPAPGCAPRLRSTTERDRVCERGHPTEGGGGALADC